MFTQKLLKKMSHGSAIFARYLREESASKQIYPKKIFSGIQPTGSMHIGNYLGAIKTWTELQNSNENVMFSIVDHHSLTVPQDPNELTNNILEMTATLLACGINPKRSILFQQSTVPQHTELCWQLGCITTMPRLAHLPQYKEKSAALKDIPLGLFVYPVLQAADILIHRATHVPVGEDQVQQLQLAQELARMFNKRYGETFPIPECLMADSSMRKIKSLRDPTKKMSKSDPNSLSRINITDSPDDIIKKIKKSVTDFVSEVTFEPTNRLGVSNLISILSAVSEKPVDRICEDAQGLDTGKFKMVVAEAVISHLSPIRKSIMEYLSEPQYLIDVLEDGRKQATASAEITAKEVRQRLGIYIKHVCEINAQKHKVVV